jgi:hypothetical protein
MSESAAGARKRSLRAAAARRLLRLAFHALRPKHPYEPLEIGGRHFLGKRDSAARWQAIADAIRRYEARTLLDIGCAEAWFLRKAAAEFGCFGIGIDAEHRRVATGEIARLHDGVERVAVMQARLAPADIRALPACDLVLCLSVVHHVFRAGGLPAAEAFVAALASRARRALLFEMGTSEERQLHWSQALPPMPAGQEAFVRGLLEKAGFVNVRIVTETAGLKGDAGRLLFSAEPGDGAQPP